MKSQPSALKTKKSGRMTIAGISQATWKWTPSLWISDHWSMTVRTRKPKISTARPT